MSYPIPNFVLWFLSSLTEFYRFVIIVAGNLYQYTVIVPQYIDSPFVMSKLPNYGLIEKQKKRRGS